MNKRGERQQAQDGDVQMSKPLDKSLPTTVENGDYSDAIEVCRETSSPYPCTTQQSIIPLFYMIMTAPSFLEMTSHPPLWMTLLNLYHRQIPYETPSQLTPASLNVWSVRSRLWSLLISPWFRAILSETSSDGMRQEANAWTQTQDNELLF